MMIGQPAGILPRVLAATAVLAGLSSCGQPRARISAIPSVPQSQFSWQSPKHVPPDGCAVVTRAEEGAPTAGERQGPVALTTGQPDPPPRGWGVEFQIPAEQARNFQGTIHPRVLKAGVTLFRLIGSGANPTGDYWANLPPPRTEEEWRTLYAVFSWWNGASCVEEYVVPKHHELRVWEGAVGPQADEGRPGYYLGGGAWQYWIPASGSQIDASVIRYARAPWAAPPGGQR